MNQARNMLHVDLYFCIRGQVFLGPAKVKVAEYCNHELMIVRRGESALHAAKPTRRDRAGDLVVVEAQDDRRLPWTGKH